MSQIKETEQKLKLVVCECGFKLLVIPDLNEMTLSIGAHAATHCNRETDMEKAEAEYSRIEELLAQRVLISISKEIGINSK
jgi:hypothetical protein